MPIFRRVASRRVAYRPRNDRNSCGMPVDSLAPKGRLFGCFFATYLEIYWLVNTKSDCGSDRPIFTDSPLHTGCAPKKSIRSCAVWWWRCGTTDVGRLWRLNDTSNLVAVVGPFFRFRQPHSPVRCMHLWNETCGQGAPFGRRHSQNECVALRRIRKGASI